MLLGGTHNMVPEAVWLLGLDIELARKCQNLDPQRVTALQQERAGERRVFCDMLVRNSLLDYETAAAIMALAEVDLEVTADFLHGLANEPLVLAFVRAAHISRARASCRALAIDTIEAQIGLEPLNLPGVAEGYPSWLIRLPVPVEDWLANSAFSSVLAAVAQERPRH
jgi:4-alpha-glucanotransferase